MGGMTRAVAKAINGNGGETKVWNPESLKTLLATNDQAVINAVVALTERQTAEEQAGGVTIKRNAVGFNATDAFLSKFAEFYRNRGYFSPKMMNTARRRIMKYTRQLLEIAQEKGAAVSFK